MYRFPLDLDLSPLVGQFTTQLCVGPFDLQFSLGDFRFVIQGGVDLYREGRLVASYRADSWPSAEFYGLLNADVVAAYFRDDRTLVITFGTGIEAHLLDTSDAYESCQILVGKTNPTVYII
jgi:hypothetical protein